MHKSMPLTIAGIAIGRHGPDYFSATPGSASGGDDIIYAVSYDGTATVQVADAHIRESGSTEYNSLTRGTQSPDGTKIVLPL